MEQYLDKENVLGALVFVAVFWSFRTIWLGFIVAFALQSTGRLFRCETSEDFMDFIGSPEFIQVFSREFPVTFWYAKHIEGLYRIKRRGP